MLVDIREERPGDVAAIRDLNKRAFGQDQEGNIVDALRSNGAALLSLVATLNSRVVGHILYMTLASPEVALFGFPFPNQGSWATMPRVL